jgi:hypothetical protein
LGCPPRQRLPDSDRKDELVWQEQEVMPSISLAWFEQRLIICLADADYRAWLIPESLRLCPLVSQIDKLSVNRKDQFGVLMSLPFRHQSSVDPLLKAVYDE